VNPRRESGRCRPENEHRRRERERWCREDEKSRWEDTPLDGVLAPVDDSDEHSEPTRHSVEPNFSPSVLSDNSVISLRPPVESSCLHSGSDDLTSGSHDPPAVAVRLSCPSALGERASSRYKGGQDGHDGRITCPSSAPDRDGRTESAARSLGVVFGAVMLSGVARALRMMEDRAVLANCPDASLARAQTA
jgi:hypothetical protein